MPTATMPVPLRSQEEALSHEVFNALMWALSYPGEKQNTKNASLVAIGNSLLDLETSFYSSDETLSQTLSKTGAKAKPLELADYLFFLNLDKAELESLKFAKKGDLLYPDHAATILLSCQFNSGQKLELSGPGIETTNLLEVSGIPKQFWELRNQTRAYPLGWDVFLCDGQSIVGIPRSTEVGL